MAYGDDWVQLTNLDWREPSLSFYPQAITCDEYGFNVYLGIWGHNYLWYSSDGGESWVKRNVGVTGNSNGIALACSNDGSIVYYIVKDGFNGFKIFRSTNFGQSFSQRASFASPSSRAYNGISCNADGTIVYLHGSSSSDFPSRCLRSTNSGNTFAQRGSTSSQQSGAIATTSDDTFLVITNFDLYRSTNKGNSFTFVDNAPILNGQDNGIDVSDDQQYMYWATGQSESSANGGIFRSLNKGDSWTNVLTVGNSNSSDSWSDVACSRDGSVVFAVNRNASNNGSCVWRSGEPKLPSDNTFIKYQGAWVQPISKQAKLNNAWRNVIGIFEKQGNNWIQVE